MNAQPAPKVHAYKLVPIAALTPYERNPRTHSAEQVAQLARSIREFGFTNPLLVDETGSVIAGHGRLLAAKLEGLSEVPVIEVAGLSQEQRRALVIADNQLALNAGWNLDLLRHELVALKDVKFDLSVVGFSPVELKNILRFPGSRGRTAPDALPEAPTRPVSEPGDLWLLGPHRVLCGDSVGAAWVETLLNGERCALLHADPPYGMGKESDGVLNDNQRGAELDAFQMAWWRTWRPYLTDNASAYIWGNPTELWRLWYGSLEASERMTYRNEIVWDKGSGFGQHAADMRSYSVNTERCLFFMLGEQGFGNVNKDDYWEGFEPIRSYLESQAIAAQFGPKDVQRICGVGMYGHWFTKSQWCMPPRKHYEALAAAAGLGAFTKPYEELRELYDGKLASGGHLGIKAEFYATRAYFDNAHDNMNEVWSFPRVAGEERFEHATPKPVAMIERCVRSSSPDGALVLEPFGGTGSTLIACETTGRRCFTMELEPRYVDVIVTRWQDFTGQVATLNGTDFNFAHVREQRGQARQTQTRAD